MRVATKTIYDMVKFNLANITEDLYKANKVVASTKRINSLSDDPVALTQSLSIRSSLSNLAQLEKNISTGRSWLNAGETALTTINALISNAKILCLQMANASVNDIQRADAAELIDGILRQIIPLGNTEINGQHIFAGTKTDIKPFTLDDETTATYDADIADGVSNAANANLGAGEFKVNGYDVVTTYATDDQYSVIDLSSTLMDSSNLTISTMAQANGVTGNTISVWAVSVIMSLQDYLSGRLAASYDDAAEWGSIVGTGTDLAAALASLVGSWVAGSIAITSFGSLWSVAGAWENASVPSSYTGFNSAFSPDINSGATVSYQAKFIIEGVSITLAFNTTIDNSVANSFISYSSNLAITSRTSAVATGGSIAQDIASAIANNASLAALNITARQIDTSAWVIERTGGGNLQILASLYFEVDQVSATDSTVSIVDSALYSYMGAQNLVTGSRAVIGNGGDLASEGLAPTAYNGESSAIAKAVAIDAIRSQSGVTATARPNIVTGATTVSSGTISSGDIYINGVNIGAATVTASDSTGALVTAINSQSSSTGVMASKDTEGKLVLTATDGRNITITANEQSDVETILGLNWTYFTGTTAIFRSTVRLNDDEAFTLSGALGDLYDIGSGASSDMAKTTDSDKPVAVTTTFKVSYSGNNSPATIKIGEDTNIEVGRDGEEAFWDQSVTINATNDKIDFREDIGEGPGFVRTLTATIPGGTYTASELADAMEDTMNDASADSGHSVTYEVSYDSSTKKFTIREDGRYPGFLEVKLLWETGDNAKTSVAPDIGFDMGDDVSSPPTSDSKVVSPINILGTNNTILFRELPAGGELSLQLTVTIPSKNYTDLNELATVIETGMEAASKNFSENNINYDVSYDSSTEKFTIKESGTDLTELQLLWSSSNAASALGFEAVDDIYTPPASDSEVEWGIFETLIELKGYLEANDVDGIFRSMTKLDSHLDHFSTTISSTGFKEIQLDIKENLIADLKLNYMDRKSSLEDADIIEAIMELKAKEFVYQAALASAARIMGLSLVDYL